MDRKNCPLNRPITTAMLLVFRPDILYIQSKAVVVSPLCPPTLQPKTSGTVPVQLLSSQQKMTQHLVRGLENAYGKKMYVI